ncbi:hypothetical protein D9756_000869 [Leucocoprinus leucothites]|uniref:Uncharacterized protein n=1 Tax=Leucocoprinus leucothites TaxID=201217 RepID=A0A8H5GFL2_9AGAR|nr:hypothetical protein D9756_000869 [Leucoagaricus leucothites]
MATSNQVSNSTARSVSSDTPAPRWSKSGNSNSNDSGRSARGRPGRVRGGGRNGKETQNAREDQAPKPNDGPTTLTADKPLRPSLPAKPSLSVTAPFNPPKPKNSSRRPSRANSTLSTSQSSPVIETPVSPASSRPPNRRKRSGAGRGNIIPKINPPAPRDNLLRPGRPRAGPAPHTAPVSDAPPHLASKQPRTPNGAFDMNKDIDALVERVRAVAMAENRPSTPGSHIDWAGDDDDSLPDLDDWGITSLSTPDPKISAISPIVVGGLKPLPELTPSSNGTAAKPQDTTSSPRNVPSRSPQPSEESSTDAAPASQSTSEEVAEKARLSEVGEAAKTTAPDDDIQDPRASGDQNSPDSEGLVQSIHAPAAARIETEKEGLAASIHAPRAIVDSSSAPAQLDDSHNRRVHGRAHTVGRPFPRPNPNDGFNNRSRNGRGGFHGSPRQHMRNHSSPATTNRPPHSRPILTGDAISRLAKVVGSTTAPPAKPTSIAND